MKAKKIDPATCRHRRISVQGSDETGCRSIACQDCAAPMSRVRDGRDYRYVARALEDLNAVPSYRQK